MTNGEIALAIIAACFAAYGLLMSFGNYFDRRRFSKQAQTAEYAVKASNANAQYYQRKLVKTQEAWQELDLKVGKATGRIRNSYLHERHLRRELDPDSYFPGKGKQHGFIAQGLAEALIIVEQETGRLFGTQQQTAEACVGAPAHGPVTAPCVVCGGHACTYRWGQCVSVWRSDTNYRVTDATIRWQNFEPNVDVGWLSLCPTHSTALDRHGHVTHVSRGYHRG